MKFRIILLSLLTLGLVSGVGKRTYSALEKAFYADENTLNFVRPGLQLKVLAAVVNPDGSIAARLRITDTMGAPLDRLGVFTPGPVSISLVAGFIPQDQDTYTSYTTRVQTSPITRQAATQAVADSGGSWTQEAQPGEYTYTFRSRATPNFDRTATHTIGAYASRNLNEFDLGVNYASTTYNFVPAGGEVTKVRDVVSTASCNSCHTSLAAHGGARRGMDLCVMCHAPQYIDPDTGNTLGMTVMTHKIHMGKALPSVVAGGKYQLIGFQQSVQDYSHIGYPMDNRNCQSCHAQEGPKAASQARNMFRPTAASCGSCHDNINFAEGIGHPRVADDTRCAQCHRPAGEREWDLSVAGAHTVPEFSRNLKGQSIELLEVTGAAPGQNASITYRLKDSEGNLLSPSDMTALSFVMAGPTSDYSLYFSESGRTDPVSPSGTATHRFNRALPSDARGSFAITAEGYRNVTFEGPDRIPTTVRDPLKNQTTYFSVDGSPTQPRRQVVSMEKCNACHLRLEFHGRNRNTTESCITCHNATMTDAARRTSATLPAESISFATMVHRIHTGSTQGRDYVLYGFGNVAHDYSKVTYPTSAANCDTCHINNSQNIPLPRGLRPVNDPRGFLPNPGATTAACLSCHTSLEAAAHAQLNTAPLGESCAVCHGPNAQFSVSRVHAR